MQNGIAIHMLTEKKYPLSQEMISKMLKKKLEVDHESLQAFELLRIDQGVGSTSGIRACALRNFDLGVMELENTQNNALAKLPMLKLGEYEMWEIRIKQYFQIQDYALWEVIENGNSWVPIPVTATETGPSTGLKMTVPSTAEEKTAKKNDVKARSLLLMALPNEHQLTFDQYVDAQSMFAAIKARFGGNEATKKTQKALLKQQYENFNASSSESLDSIFNRLQKLVSRLAILGVVTPPEDLNLKFLRCLPSEWDTYVVVWMNKPDFDTIGLDDLYNNFKIVKQKVKKSVGTNNDDKNLAFLTTSGASSTNIINTANPEVSTGNTKVNTASTKIRSAEATNDDNGEVRHSMTITEASLRRHLKLDDHDSTTSIPNSEIFEQLALMGYHTDSDNPKKIAWEQSSSNIATAVICQEVALFPTMLDVSEPSTSPSRITSSPSHSPEPSPSHSPEPSIEHSPEPSIEHSPEPSFEHSPDHTTTAVSQPSPTQPSPTQPSHAQPSPRPLHVVHSHGSAEGSLKLFELTTLVTKLSEKVGELEDDLKKTKLTYSAAVTKLILRVKKLETKLKAGTTRKRARVVLSEDDEDKGNSEVSTAGATKGTASEVLVDSTAEVNISTAGRTVTYRRRSEEKRTRKDKGKAIMTESEPKKKIKESDRQWDEEERQRAMSEAKSSKKIDWNDPSVIRYHALKMKPKTIAQARRNMVKYLKNQGNYKISDFKGMSYNEIRPIFEKVWDFNQHIEPMDLEHGSERMKSPEKIEEEDVDTQKEMKEVSKESGAKERNIT
ncbi:hypothetical protein Tco_1084760 [Tanacetum coccineum]